MEVTQGTFSAAPSVANSSGQGDGAALPAAAQGLNWGAFFFGWIWSAFNGGGALWIIVGLLFSPIDRFYLLFKGNGLAWKNKPWASVEAFQATQRKWMLVGLVIVVLAILFGVVSSLLGGMAASGN
jgi:hypothetical protein